MYKECPICENKRFVSREDRTFVCPYCRGTGNDICPHWPLERKKQMLNIIMNKPANDFTTKNKTATMHVPISHLIGTINKPRGRPRKS